MADLFDHATLPKHDQAQATGHKLPESLPTISEMGDVVRRDIERAQLLELIPSILPAIAPEQSPATESSGGLNSGNDAVSALLNARTATKDVILSVHEEVLRQLALTDPTLLAAYQLGRALRDTCWLPNKARGAAFFLREFNRDRLAVLQGWLGQVSSTLPAQSAEVVSRSLTSWQMWADVNARGLISSWDDDWPGVIHGLRQQSHVWHGLLSGEIDVPRTPSMEAWMYAGDSILRTVSHFTWRAVRRFYVPLALLVVTTAAVIIVGIHDANGLTKFWTAAASVAGFIGISGASLRAGAQKAAGTLETSIRDAAELDAQAWESTWLPPTKGRGNQLRLSNQGVASSRAGRDLPASD